MHLVERVYYTFATKPVICVRGDGKMIEFVKVRYQKCLMFHNVKLVKMGKRVHVNL